MEVNSFSSVETPEHFALLAALVKLRNLLWKQIEDFAIVVFLSQFVALALFGATGEILMNKRWMGGGVKTLFEFMLRDRWNAGHGFGLIVVLRVGSARILVFLLRRKFAFVELFKLNAVSLATN